MIGRGFRARVWAAGVVACAAAGVAPAQYAPVGVASPGVPCVTGECAAANRGSYGSAFFAPNRGHGKWLSSSQPACANNNFPLSDWAYIRKYCGPTLIPGTPYGHFETKWRKWDDHAGGGCATGAAGIPDGVVVGEPVVPPAMPVVEPMPAPKPPDTLPKTAEPKPGDAKPVDPVAPPKLPTIPKQVNADIPAPLPQVMPATSDKPSLEAPVRVIIPPLPELPSKR